jgi:hypothetical protein
MNKHTITHDLTDPLDPDVEAELDRLLSMTHAEVCASLRARGYNLGALQAEADVHYARMQPKRKLPSAFIAGGVTFVSTAGIVIANLVGAATPSATPYLATAAAPAPVAVDETLDAGNHTNPNGGDQ